MPKFSNVIIPMDRIVAFMQYLRAKHPMKYAALFELMMYPAMTEKKLLSLKVKNIDLKDNRVANIPVQKKTMDHLKMYLKNDFPKLSPNTVPFKVSRQRVHEIWTKGKYAVDIPAQATIMNLRKSFTLYLRAHNPNYFKIPGGNR